MSDPAIGYRFLVSIDGRELGVFSKVEGLGAKYEVLTVKEGGENGYVHALPGRMSYDNLKLTRPIDGDSGRIASWFSQYRSVLQSGGQLEHATARVSAYGTDDQVVATWELEGVHPVSYSGPSFQAGSSSVLTETLELAHRGFAFSAGEAAPPPASKPRIGRPPMATAGPALGRSF